jgi:hypothetical protein
VVASNKTLLAVLNSAQQNQLAGLEKNATAAMAVLMAYSESFFSNLVVLPWSTEAIDNLIASGGWPSSIIETGGSATTTVMSAISTSVIRVRTERASARVQAARRARMVPLVPLVPQRQ